MRYKSMSEKKIRIASTSGHIIMVGEEFKEVPEHMEPDARAAGCIAEDVFNKLTSAENVAEPLTADERIDLIVLSIKEMAADNPEGNFTKNGSPNRKILNAKCGFTVTAEEFDVCWSTVKEELTSE